MGGVAYLPMETDVDGDNLKSFNAPGFRGVAQGMLKYRDPHSSWSAPASTLEIERVHFYVIIKLPPISFTLHRTQAPTESWSRVDVSACVGMNKYWD